MLKKNCRHAACYSCLAKMHVWRSAAGGSAAAQEQPATCGASTSARFGPVRRPGARSGILHQPVEAYPASDKIDTGVLRKRGGSGFRGVALLPCTSSHLLPAKEEEVSRSSFFSSDRCHHWDHFLLNDSILAHATVEDLLREHARPHIRREHQNSKMNKDCY